MFARLAAGAANLRNRGARGRQICGRWKSVTIALAVLAGAWQAAPAYAVTYWQTTAADGSWSNATNWTAGIPSTSNAAVFSTSNFTTTNNDGDKHVLGVSFVNLGSGISDFTMNTGSGGVLYVYDEGITVNGGNQTFGVQIRPRGSMTIANNGAGLLRFNSQVLVHLLTLPGSATITFDGSGNTQVASLGRRTSDMDVNVVKQGPGLLTIVGYDAADATPSAGGAIVGTMSILGGTVSINNERNLGANLPAFNAAGLLLNGGTLRATASFAIDDSNRGVTLGASGGTFEVLNAADTLTIANAITGAGGLTKSGAGTLLLSGTDTYGGTTRVNQGILRLGSAGAIPAGGAVVVAGGTLDFNGFGPALTNVTISGTGVDANTGALANTSSTASYGAVTNLTLAGNATVGSNVGGPGNNPGRLAFDNGTINLADFTLTKVGSSELLWRAASSSGGGTLAINAGAVNIESYNNNLPTTQVNNGGTLSTYGDRSENAVLTLNGGATLAAYNGTGTWTGPITLGTGTVTLNAGDATGKPFYTGGNLTINGSITGNATLSKIGGNTLTLGAANAGYTGAIQVNAGILRLGNVDALGNATSVTVASGATVDFNGMAVVGKDFTIAGAGSSGQGALYNGTGGPIGQIGVTLAADATIGVTTGRLDIGLGRPLVGNGFTLTKIGAGNLPIRGDAGSFGAIRVNEGIVYFETNQTNLGAVPITVASGATLASYYTITVNSPVVLNSGGTLRQLGGGGTGTWSGPVTVNGASTLSASGGNLTLSGPVSGTGSLSIAGTPNIVTLSGDNSAYSGAIQVASGVLRLGSATALGATPGVTVASGATVDLYGQNPGAARRDFTIAGTGVSDQGALNNSVNAYSQINNLTLTADAKVNANGRVDVWGTINAPGFVLTKTGTGECLDLRGTITALGGLRIDQGRLRYENPALTSWTGPITINGGVLTPWGSYTLNNPITLAGGGIGAENGGTTTLANTVNVASNSVIDYGAGNTAITGSISGPGGLTTTGANTLTIAASNSVGSLGGLAKLALNNGVTLTAGSNGANTTYGGQIMGAGALAKTGAGAMILANPANNFSGGAKVSAGTLAAWTPGALGTGTVTLDGGTLALTGPGVVSGFGGSGAGWTLNNGATAAGDVLTVTTAVGNLARSAFYNQPVPTTGFTVNFTYLADQGSSPNPADGLAVVFQVDGRGTTALGAAGGALGYSGITPSKAWGINLYPTTSQGISNSVWTNGAIAGGYDTGTGIAIYGTPFDVQLTYNDAAKTLTALLTQGAATYTKIYTGVDLPATLGNLAYVGITGGTGGAYARQQVSNFTYSATSLPGTTYANALAVTAGQTGTVSVSATGATPAFSMGTLGMGAGSTLRLAAEANSTANQPYSLTLGATTLAGPATFDVANNGTGLGTLILGAVGQNSASSLSKTGAGTLRLTGVNTYTGNTTVLGGTLELAHGSSANTIAASPVIDVRTASTLAIALPSQTLVLANQILKGTGTVAGRVAGSGTVTPGNSPGILTVTSINPALGALSFPLEFTQTDPIYANLAASANDVLRLTDASSPFASPMGADDVVDLYFHVSSFGVGSVFRGGFYTDRGASFSSDLAGATFNYFVYGDGGGTHLFEGVPYYTLAEHGMASGVQWRTVPWTTQFGGSGPAVNGFVLEFTAVPEPATLVLSALGAAALYVLGWRRRGRARARA